MLSWTANMLVFFISFLEYPRNRTGFVCFVFMCWGVTRHIVHSLWLRSICYFAIIHYMYASNVFGRWYVGVRTIPTCITDQSVDGQRITKCKYFLIFFRCSVTPRWNVFMFPTKLSISEIILFTQTGESIWIWDRCLLLSYVITVPFWYGPLRLILLLIRLLSSK